MPNPDEDLELPGTPERRPSQLRQKRPDSTTKLIRVPPPSTRPEPEVSHVVKSPGLGQDRWGEVVNPAPYLPDPAVKRPLPPPAPLPSEASTEDLGTPGWTDERARRKRLENIIGTVGLAIMVAAMLAAIWLRMTGGTG